MPKEIDEVDSDGGIGDDHPPSKKRNFRLSQKRYFCDDRKNRNNRNAELSPAQLFLFRRKQIFNKLIRHEFYSMSELKFRA